MRACVREKSREGGAGLSEPALDRRSRPRSDGRVADDGGGRRRQPAAEQGRLAKPAADNDDSNSHEDYEINIDMLKIDMLDIN